jgi:hypothetical protein
MTQKTERRRRTSTFDLGEDFITAMDRLFDRDGISRSEQVRRALVPFLEAKGVWQKPQQKLKSERQQPASRRRS